MLKEIYCDKFIENGKVRPKIVFHAGLNTIVGIGTGEKKSENSVGKSTLLMIIDFCFGGRQFLNSKAVQIIGNHTIRFAFEFNSATYYFMRTTDAEDSIFKCDETYRNPQKYKIEEFKQWLKEQYNLNHIALSFREIVNTYFRFYNDKEISPKNILRTYNGDSDTEQIRRLEHLFEKYPHIQQFAEKIQDAQNRDKIKKNASHLKVELEEFKKIDTAKIQEQIDELTSEKEFLLKNKNEQIAKLDAQKAAELAELKMRHKTLAAKRSRLLTRIENLEHSQTGTPKPSAASYDALLEFFPNADIEHIEEIDAFHAKLSDILAEEHQESLAEYTSELAEIRLQIENLEKQISDIGTEDDFTTAFLIAFSKIQSQIDALNALLKKEDARKLSAKKLSEDKKIFKIEERTILEEIAGLINKKLKAFCETVLGENVESIRFDFPTNARYTLGSPLDDGTGTDYTSLILFDLSVLGLTKLPAVIHDSYLISNIRGSRLENLIKQYAKITEKQVFLAIDETDKLSIETETIVNKDTVCVIKLRHGGGELYGSYWGTKGDSAHGK